MRKAIRTNRCGRGSGHSPPGPPQNLLETSGWRRYPCPLDLLPKEGAQELELLRTLADPLSLGPTGALPRHLLSDRRPAPAQPPACLGLQPPAQVPITARVGGQSPDPSPSRPLPAQSLECALNTCFPTANRTPLLPTPQLAPRWTQPT